MVKVLGFLALALCLLAPLPANAQYTPDAINVTATGAAAGVLTGLPVATAGYAAIEVNISAFSATSLTPQASFDGGQTYTTVQCVNVSSPTGGNAISIAAVGVYECSTGDHFQMTQVGAGAVTAKITLKITPSGVGRASYISGNSASGSADSGSPVKVGCVFTTAPAAVTNAQRVNTWCDQFGNFGYSPQGGGIVYETANSGNVAAATATATLAAAAAKTTWITGLAVSSGGATAGGCVTGTITGIITATQNFTYCVPTGATVGAQPFTLSFVPPIPASAVNTTIAVSIPSVGAGATNTTVSATGFQQ